MKKKIGYPLLILIIVIQFFRIDKTNPETNLENDFIEVKAPSEDVTTILKTTCYDCHSNESKYPWYSNLAPISWWLKDHIDEGREELNFSEWETYTKGRKDHKLEEMIEMVEEDEMPLKEYTWIHSDAKLTTEQKSMLLSWLKNMLEEEDEIIIEEPEPEILQLNNGEKWAANTETVEAIDNMIVILATEYDEERVINYSSDGQKLEIEFNKMIENCTMTGEAHEQLHRYIMPLKLDIEALIECESLEDCGIQLFDLLKYLSTFKEFFVERHNSQILE